MRCYLSITPKTLDKRYIIPIPCRPYHLLCRLSILHNLVSSRKDHLLCVPFCSKDARTVAQNQQDYSYCRVRQRLILLEGIPQYQTLSTIPHLVPSTGYSIAVIQHQLVDGYLCDSKLWVVHDEHKFKVSKPSSSVSPLTFEQ